MTNILSEKHKGSKIFKKVKKYFSSKKAEAKVIEEEKDFIGEVKDFMKDLVIIVLLVLFIRTFLAMPFQINGQSMYSSYYDKEFIIVDRLSYRIWDIQRGDVVVFKPHVSQVKEFYLKRIIGLPGETVMIKDGIVSIKNQWSDSFTPLDETYLNEENNGYTFVNGQSGEETFVIPQWEYFVLWDNRNHSTDSRQCFASCAYPGAVHFVRGQDITGKVFLDLGYFNFKAFDFIHPELAIDTTPKFLNSPKNHDYK